MTEPIGPDYRPFVSALLEAAARLAIAVRELRPDTAGISLQPPEIVLDLAAMECTIALRMDAERVAIVDQFSMDPQNPQFGLSQTPFIPWGNSGNRH